MNVQLISNRKPSRLPNCPPKVDVGDHIWITYPAEQTRHRINAIFRGFYLNPFCQWPKAYFAVIPLVRE